MKAEEKRPGFAVNCVLVHFSMTDKEPLFEQVLTRAVRPELGPEQAAQTR